MASRCKCAACSFLFYAKTVFSHTIFTIIINDYSFVSLNLGAGARPGDSGGGLLFRKANTHGNLYYLRGIVSNKDGTIGEKQTSIAAFTDVAQFASWMYDKRIEIENEELLGETKVGLKT